MIEPMAQRIIHTNEIPPKTNLNKSQISGRSLGFELGAGSPSPQYGQKDA